jgi:hypothetical protein
MATITNSIYEIVKIIHIICGFLALSTGLVPMFAAKGGKTHIFWGRIYYWAMFGVFITTVIFFVLYPTKVFYQFFLGIAILSFYNTFTGVRILKTKATGNAPELIDWVAATVAAVCGLGMIILAILVYLKEANTLSILLSIFGLGILLTGIQDLRVFAGKVPREKMHWFFHHIARMMGSYAATVTAFCVNIVPRFLPENMPSFVQLILWIAPGVIIGTVANRWSKKYRNQMGNTAKK